MGIHTLAVVELDTTRFTGQFIVVVVTVLLSHGITVFFCVCGNITKLLPSLVLPNSPLPCYCLILHYMAGNHGLLCHASEEIIDSIFPVSDAFLKQDGKTGSTGH